MSKTKKEIEKEKGTCEKVATNFWECKDKDGKVWWCDGSGNCVEKPSSLSIRMTIDDMRERGAKCNQVTDNLLICRTSDGTVWACDLQSGGCSVIIPQPQEEPCNNVRDKIHDAAVKALRNFPSEESYKKHNDETYQFITQSRKLIERCTKAQDMSDEELECVASQIAFIHASFGIGFAQGRIGGVFENSEQSCTFKCKGERDKCLSDDGCTGGWPCVCCVPCNVAWLACTADCMI